MNRYEKYKGKALTSKRTSMFCFNRFVCLSLIAISDCKRASQENFFFLLWLLIDDYGSLWQQPRQQSEVEDQLPKPAKSFIIIYLISLEKKLLFF